MMNGRSSQSRRRKVHDESSVASTTETVTENHRKRVSWRRWIVLRGRRIGIFPLLVVVVVILSWIAVKKTPFSSNHSSHTSALRHSSRVGVLRRDWTSFTRLSALAQEFKELQNNCAVGEKRNQFSALCFGLGSELHRWTQQICESYSSNQRIRSALFKDSWTWLDQKSCNLTEAREVSPLACYFPSAEGQCTATKKPPSAHVSRNCDSLKEDLNLTTADVRTAGIEFLFSHVSPLIIEEAQRQVKLVFGGKPVPENLITVHVRWGDKVTSREMSFISVEDYINATKTLVEKRDPNGQVSVYLATEDPKAVQQFHEKAPSDWDIYVDQYFHEVKKHRQVGKELWNQAVETSKETKGRAGLLTLASLLVAMEANDYVLTTASNWSRLMNELRTAILDVECDSCTRMIDLQGPSKILAV